MNIHDESTWPVWAAEEIEIEEPKQGWQEKGRQEKQLLLGLLSHLGITQIEHYGSTSIPNLPSKPIIDLMAKINSFRMVEEEVLPILRVNDWHYVHPDLDQRPWQRFFVKVNNDKRAAHLHLLLKDNDRWDKQLLFRDRLQSNPYLVTEYANLKKKSAEKFKHNREQYTKSKTEFINSVIK
jgi:GrpB-like predicted nucleotidyltransferase (UPF0157 family)